LRWEKGSFRVLHRAYDGDSTLSSSIERVLLDGLTAADHYRRLSSQLGSGSAPIVLEGSQRLFERSFDDPTAATLLLVETYRTLDQVLEQSALGELETLRILDDLLGSGVLATPPAALG